MNSRKETSAHETTLICEPGGTASSDRLRANERRTARVVGLTFAMMVIEISFGFLTHSMALLADGWHMAADVGALAISLFAYRFARSGRLSRALTFGGGKLLPLAGYTSGLTLVAVALWIGIECADRWLHPQPVQFVEALTVSAIGLAVNLTSAWILHGGRAADGSDHGPTHAHGHSHAHGHDHNHQSASLHVLADAVTSLLAILALTVGHFTGSTGWDAVAGFVGGLLILVGAVPLLRATALELLDARYPEVESSQIQAALDPLGAKLVDLHIWRLSPEAVACEVVLEASELRGSQSYRTALEAEFSFEHLVIEERLRQK